MGLKSWWARLKKATGQLRGQWSFWLTNLSEISNLKLLCIHGIKRWKQWWINAPVNQLSVERRPFDRNRHNLVKLLQPFQNTIWNKRSRLLCLKWVQYEELNRKCLERNKLKRDTLILSLYWLQRDQTNLALILIPKVLINQMAFKMKC